MLSPVPIPGLLVTGTDTAVGKTLVAGAIARWFHTQARRVAVCKPACSGCVRRREGLVSEDAEFLAHCAESRHPLDLICPQRYVEPLAPAVAAQRAQQPIDWSAIERSIDLMSQDSDVMVVEGVGGLMVPMDDKHTFLDVAVWLRLPVVIVARAGLGTINHTLLTLSALRSRGLKVAGVVINRYPTDTPDVAEETNPPAIERWGKTHVLCVVPEDPAAATLPTLTASIMTAVGVVDWDRLSSTTVR